MSYSLVKIKPPFDITKNFWKENIQISLIEPYRSIYLRDTSPDKDVSSREMWCIWLHEDPNYDNKIYRMPYQDKVSAIKAYNPNFDFNDLLIAEALMKWSNHCLTRAARAFKQEEDTMEQRAAFINGAEYTFDTYMTDADGKQQTNKFGSPILVKGTAKDLDMMRKATKDITTKYSEVRKVFEAEMRSVRLHGGGEESLMEKGGLTLLKEVEETGHTLKLISDGEEE